MINFCWFFLCSKWYLPFAVMLNFTVNIPAENFGVMHLWLKYLIRMIVLALTSAERLFKLSILHTLPRALLVVLLPWLDESTPTSVPRDETASPCRPFTPQSFVVRCGELRSSWCLGWRYEAARLLWDLWHSHANITPSPWCEIPADLLPPGPDPVFSVGLFGRGCFGGEAVFGEGWLHPCCCLAAFPAVLPFAGCKRDAGFHFWTLIPLASKWRFNYLESYHPLCFHYCGCIYP